MAIIKQTERKEFEKPNAGLVPVTIIDVIDLGWVPTTFNNVQSETEKIRVVWILGSKDSEGRPFRIISDFNKNINMNPKTGKKSRLYELIEQVFQAPPGKEFDDETLVGRSNRAFLAKETNAITGKIYTNIKGLLPLEVNDVPPVAPEDFVREMNKPNGIRPRAATVAGQATQTASAASNTASNTVSLN